MFVLLSNMAVASAIAKIKLTRMHARTGNFSGTGHDLVQLKPVRTFFDKIERHADELSISWKHQLPPFDTMRDRRNRYVDEEVETRWFDDNLHETERNVTAEILAYYAYRNRYLHSAADMFAALPQGYRTTLESHIKFLFEIHFFNKTSVHLIPDVYRKVVDTMALAIYGLEVFRVLFNESTRSRQVVSDNNSSVSNGTTKSSRPYLIVIIAVISGVCLLSVL